MEPNIGVSTPTKKGQLEEKIEMLHKTIRDLSLQKANLWFSNFWEEGHAKDTCKHQTVWVIQTQHFCEICREITHHLTIDYPYNLRK